MTKLLFIQPTQYAQDGTSLCKQSKIYLPGLVFPLLAAMTPKSWDIKIAIEVVDEIDFDMDVDLVGIGTMGHAIFRGLEIAREFKKRGKTVFFGGYMASMVPQKVLEMGVDSVVIGDAEISWPQLVHDWETRGRLEPIYDNPITSLEKLPLPRYEFLLEKPIGNMLPVQAGRGCPHLCSFCSIACIYRGKYLTRPIDEVMRDIYRVKQLGFKSFYLIDDNIVGNPTYLEELARRIKPLKMSWASQCSLNLARNEPLLELVAQSGCNILSFGLESITQSGLDKLNKKWVKVSEHEDLLARINDAGIMPSTEMMVGIDSDTEESIRETYDFVERTKISIPRFYILTPMPGSELYNQYKAEGRLLHEDYKRYDGSQCVHRPENISPEKLTEMYWWLNRKVFSLPSIMRRTVLKKEAARRPGVHLFALGANLHYRHYIKRGITPNIF
ncbi:B12-binding domain-containing radical SAM protein [Myxococcota bacterium]|nr:B12-binding domain-containing radical SAM protein [Myxococcota bacterium]MBU1536763.1 B12-binding domain-containing radical SAM protein [Myxococcota bacterium]